MMKEKIVDGKDIGQLGLLLLILIVVLKILFYKEAAIVVVRTALTLFWLFVLPGYFAMNYWKKEFGFAERIVIGTALSAGIAGIASYYLGLFGLHIRYQWIIPSVIIALSLLIQNKASRNKQNESNNS